MTDAPKRRPGRPRKAPVDFEVVAQVPPRPKPIPHIEMRPWVVDARSALRDAPTPLPRMRLRAGQVQQAWQHPTGIEWRPLPVAPDTAPDWEDG